MAAPSIIEEFLERKCNELLTELEGHARGGLSRYK